MRYRTKSIFSVNDRSHFSEWGGIAFCFCRRTEYAAVFGGRPERDGTDDLVAFDRSGDVVLTFLNAGTRTSQVTVMRRNTLLSFPK